MRLGLDGWLDLLLPRVCAGCRRPLGDDAPLCDRCRRRLPRLSAADEPPRRGPLEACVAEVAFAEEAADWIHRLKYPRGGLAGADPRPAVVVAWLAASAARRLPGPTPDCVVPIPTSPRRWRERGFHPAGELAHAVGRALARPVEPRLLEQVRATASQTGLDRRARRRNVAGAFRAAPAARGRRIALVDDVVTTGATLSEAARTLRAAGARQIVAVCAARTPLGDAGDVG